MGYSREQLERCHGATVPDVIGDGCRLMFVGINPGLWTAMTGWHFAHPSNRFWPALRKAGLIDFEPDINPLAPAVPLSVTHSIEGGDLAHGFDRFYSALSLERPRRTDNAMRAKLVDRGIGITNLVAHATARASELTRADLVAGGARLADQVAELAPEVVAVAGVTAYRTAFGEPKASVGPQSRSLAEAELWIVPNPSGLNAHETVDTLAAWYRQVGDAAGIADD